MAGSFWQPRCLSQNSLFSRQSLRTRIFAGIRIKAYFFCFHAFLCLFLFLLPSFFRRIMVFITVSFAFWCSYTTLCTCRRMRSANFIPATPESVASSVYYIANKPISNYWIAENQPEAAQITPLGVILKTIEYLMVSYKVTISRSFIRKQLPQSLSF